ncbi:hypothetical protein KY290_025618 [Solanum tuberosum]|uniref:Lectin n=1 Tax=Solanum tuberosum TaxID=4113 RepID=A0ABQ7UW31_SOLTU|nr:hypothetical protein KY289_024693 [Solanum tuberosum]KAH0755348.1 hypothetical protein KY290_025618 [Solanum tuberosum]
MSAWLGARELSIEWADNPQHWTWNYIHNSSVEVAELLNVCWLDIRGKIDTSRLTRKTSYSAYLVFRLTDNHRELERGIASVRFVKDKAEGTDEEGYTVFISKAKRHEGERGIFAYPRSDAWLETKLGEFFNNFGEDGEVEMRLMENKNPNWKSGIISKWIDAKDLIIAFVDDWTWTSLDDSGIEVAELVRTCWLDISTTIDTKQLTKKTSFTSYLVFKLKEDSHGLEKAIGSVRLLKQEINGHEGYNVYFSNELEGKTIGRFPRRWSDNDSDEWMEIKLGEFYNNLGNDGEIEISLMNTKDVFTPKSGLIVKGIEIRPT